MKRKISIAYRIGIAELLMPFSVELAQATISSPYLGLI